LLVNGFNGLGLATLTRVTRLFGSEFTNIVFVRVGEIDSPLLRGPNEIRQLEQQITDDPLEYCTLAANFGFHAELCTTIGSDVVLELQRLCLEVVQEFPKAVFFAGQLAFSDELESYFSRFLHNHTAMELLRWLQLRGLSLLILAIRVALPKDSVEPTRRRTDIGKTDFDTSLLPAAGN
jgi:hypothetical protein